MNANNVEIGPPKPEPANNIPVEVLIGQEADHLSLSGAPRQEPFTDIGAGESLLIFDANARVMFFSQVPVFVHLVLVREAVGDHGIDVGEGEAVVSVDDALGAGAEVERSHDGIEGDPSLCDTDHSVFILVERHSKVLACEAHADPPQV